MIGRMAVYPYGNVRARALATRLLSSGELLGLAGNDSPSQAEAEIERRLNLAESPSSIDHRLQTDYLNFAHLILRTLPEALRDLFRAYLDRPWLENLLLLCRTVLGDSEPGDRPDLQPMYPGHPLLPEPDGVESLQEISEAFAGGPYREVLANHLEKEGESELSLLESRLIRTYWDLLGLQVRGLPSLDRDAAVDILARRADIDALRHVRRGIEAGFDPDLLLELRPPLARIPDPDSLRRLLGSENAEESLQGLLHRAVGKNEEDFEPALLRSLHRYLRRRLLDPPFGVAVPLSALLLKELEVLDLQGLLGGLRYQLEPESILSFLAAGKV